MNHIEEVPETPEQASGQKDAPIGIPSNMLMSEVLNICLRLAEDVREMREAIDSAGRETLFSTQALADRWGVSTRTIETEVSEGNLVPTFIRGARRFTLGSVEQYERSNSGTRKRSSAARRKAAKRSRLAPSRSPIEGRTSSEQGGESDV